MVEAANYSAVETLRNGHQVEIRALRPDDRADLVAAVGRTSSQSLYRRFFAVRRNFKEGEIAFFVNIDFTTHVALVVVVEEGGLPMIVGGGRYIVVEPEKAEVALPSSTSTKGKELARHCCTISPRSPEMPGFRN